MDLRTSPALVPAAGLLAGTFLAFDLAHRPVAALALLAAFGLAWGRAGGRFLACFALGLLAAEVRCLEPLRSGFRADLERPVEAVVRPVDHWQASLWGGWRVGARVERLRQGGAVALAAPAVTLELEGEEPPPAPGSTLRVRGYLRRGAGYANRPPIPPGPWRLGVESRRLLTVVEEPGGVARLSTALRTQVETAYARFPEDRPGVALTRALVLGDPARLPDRWRRALNRCGLGHLLAVSGLHVGLLAALVAVAASAVAPRPRLLLVAAAVVVYLLLVGPRPSLLRASAMALLAVAALLLERPPSAANALALAAAGLALARPEVVREVGFQLTVAATAGIVLLAPALVRRWPALPPWLGRPLAAAVGAQLATLPFALPAFHLLSPLAPLLNLVAVPASGVILGGCLLWTALALALPAAAAPLLPLLDALAAPFGWPALWPPGPLTAVPLVLPPLLAPVLAALLLAVAWWPRRPLAWLAAGLALALGCAWPPRSPGVELALLDVGQGDAILLRDGSRALLVDGGGWPAGDFGGRVLLPALAGLGVRRLEAAVLTHPDRDHCRGLVDLASYLPVAEVWTAPGWEEEPCARELLAGPARVRLVRAGDEARLGRWRLRILHPEAASPQARNDRSLVILAEAGGRRILLTGDVEATAERELLARTPELSADVLKVAHHGSKTSTSPAFLAAVRPALALVSAGRSNPYGHPSPVVLDRLTAARVRVLRTDRSGLVRIELARGEPLRISFPGG